MHAPATRNASLQLAPERSSTLAALRSVCMATGAIVTISVATAVLATAVLAAVVLICALRTVACVPEHHRTW